MADILRMIPPDGHWNRNHTFAKIIHGDLEYWVDVTVIRKLRGMDSAKLYRLEEGKLIFDHYEAVWRVRKEEGVY